jgi:hypothetical protein
MARTRPIPRSGPDGMTAFFMNHGIPSNYTNDTHWEAIYQVERKETPEIAGA